MWGSIQKNAVTLTICIQSAILNSQFINILEWDIYILRAKIIESFC